MIVFYQSCCIVKQTKVIYGWSNNGGSKRMQGRNFFYAYYSGLFCRILCVLDSYVKFRHFVRDCYALLDKYKWYNIQREDLELCASGSSHDCEVPDALDFIEGVDNVAWKDSGFGNGSDAVCLKKEHSSWTFADVRGGIYRSIQKPQSLSD